jgi:chromosome segregation ATPase
LISSSITRPLEKGEERMKPNREMMEDQLETCEDQLKSFTSYLHELKDTTAKLGTDSTQFEEDLMEVENNVKYYGGEVARLKTEIGKLGKAAPQARTAVDSVLPHTLKQGMGSLLLSSISFAAGMLLGSMLNERRNK